MVDGKVIVVTQVLHFVGKASARVLRDQGARVICHDDTFDDAGARDAFLAEVEGVEASPSKTGAGAIAQAIDGHGRIDALVSNDAYPALRAPIVEASLADFRETLEKLMVQPLANAAAALPAMRRAGKGSIVLVTSAAPFKGLPNYGMYVAARAGANGLAVSMAKEVAKDGIRVNAVAPNYIESPTYFPPALLADPESLAKIQKNIPLGRLGQPEEVGSVIALLCGDAAGFLTGQVIPIAGGWP